jgi:hypothetical protein
MVTAWVIELSPRMAAPAIIRRLPNSAVLITFTVDNVSKCVLGSQR